jgi:hypothetical protein
MNSAINALDKAVYDRLSLALSRSSIPIYDDVPDNAKYPYVVMGEGSEEPELSTLSTLSRNTQTIHIWSKYRGNKEVCGIIDIICAAFDDPLSMETGFSQVELIPARSEVTRVFDQDTNTLFRHGEVTLRAIIDRT